MVPIESLKPTYCVWELTLACNLRCGHCGSRAGKARPDEMSTAECISAVASLADLGCEVITLSGGEPTLRPDWADIARAVRDRGMIVNMVTNGIDLDETVVAGMRAAGLANLAVSLDGPEEIHNRIRGQGTFQKTCRSVRLLRDAGLPVTVMTTINTLNLARLEEVYRVAAWLGADRWRCQLGKPMGNMQTNDELVIKPRDLLRLMPELSRLNEQGPVPVGIGDSIGYYGPYDTPLRAVSWKGTPQCWAGCQAGKRCIGIEADGGIKGCLSMQAFSNGPDPFLEDNIRRRPLKDIWLDPDAFSYNRKFDPDSLTGFCCRCNHRKICKGGARCVASAATGRISEDPYCYHRVAALATAWPLRNLKQHLATAASVATFMFAGCANYGPPVGPDYGTEPPDCEEVCCECPETPQAWFGECCALPEYGIQPDYGVEPPDCDQISCGDPNLDPDLYQQCCGLDYGAEPPCEDVSCTDPNLDPELFDLCCVHDEYGVEPPCQNVSCQNPDPELSVEDYEYCCGPIDCNEVCCGCDYGEIPPPQVIEKCCDDDEEP